MSDTFTITGVDIAVFLTFIAAVISLGLYKSKGEGKSSEEFFLAGRGLKWWLIGVSLIAANISSEQFVGMSGSAADYLGLAIASYEWMAAITLVVVAFCFLPYFLRTGIFTMPQFLEHRYNGTARTLMAASMLLILVGVSLTGIIYAGGLTMSELFAGKSLFGISLGLTAWCWIIGVTAALYVAAGGLKASAWADLIQGIALIVGGGIIAYFAFQKLGATPMAELTPGGANPREVADTAGGLSKLVALNHEKLNMVLPRDDKNIPWTALLIGLWIPNFYYWGLNQYITQRILGSASLKEGQKGIVFAAAMKLIIPFVIVIPGIIAFNLYSAELAVAQQRSNDRTILKDLGTPGATTVFVMTEEWKLANPDRVAELDAHNTTVRANVEAPREVEIRAGYKFDAALNTLIKNLLPPGSGLTGFVLAALLGAIVSSLAAVLNASSTIFTMDVFGRIYPNASQHTLVTTGRLGIGVFAVIGCIVAPLLDNFGSIFKYIQEFQGYISSGVLAVFVFGIINRTAPGVTGVVGLLLNPVLYALIARFFPNIAFLDRMAICFGSILAVMWVIGLVKPLPHPIEFKSNTRLNLEGSKSARLAGVAVVVVTLILYLIFSPLGIAG
ncbi:MAG: sodium/solute symporter [Verrucomicrobia bacterium]|nr:sodium/solute symporter [Verrucomicrobiota bacterium]